MGGGQAQGPVEKGLGQVDRACPGWAPSWPRCPCRIVITCILPGFPR